MHARLNRKFFYYAVKYAQYIHDVIPVCDLLDENGLPITPYYLATGRKPAVKYFRVLGCPTVFKRYEVSSDGKRIHNKYNQQGMRGIFVGIPDDAYQGAIKLRGTGNHILNQDTTYEHTGAPIGQEETFPHEDYDMQHPSRKHTISDISDLVSYPKRRNHKVPEEEARYTQTINNSKNIQTEDQPSTNKYDKVESYFTTMKNCPED